MKALLFVLVAVFALEAQDGARSRDPRTLKAAAVETWKEWTREDDVPDVVRARVIEAARAYQGGDLGRALALDLEILDELHDYPPILHGLGTVYFRLRRYGDAAHVFERFLAHAPGEVGFTRALGHCYYSLGEYDKASVHYEKIIALNPKLVEALRGYALARMRLGDTEIALAKMREVSELDPKHWEALAWIAQMEFDEENLEQAQEACARARDLSPYEPRSWFLLSRIQIELGEEQAAEASRQRFLELDRVTQDVRSLEGKLGYDPNQPELWQTIARLRTSIGDIKRGRTALGRLIRLDPLSLEYRVAALGILEAAGDKEGATAMAQGLETNCSDQAEAWNQLEKFYGRRRDRVNQVRCGERYLRMQAE